MEKRVEHTHSYFAVMGGFEIVFDHANMAFFPDKQNRTQRKGLRLASNSLTLLERDPSLMPDIPLQQIQDKSKGSLFAKVLVCFQGM